MESDFKPCYSGSISIDGPKEMHDTHRLDHKDRSSFDKVYKALLLLKRFPKIFSGCIAVVNPNYEPRELIKFFADNQIAGFNFLFTRFSLSYSTTRETRKSKSL